MPSRIAIPIKRWFWVALLLTACALQLKAQGEEVLTIDKVTSTLVGRPFEKTTGEIRLRLLRGTAPSPHDSVSLTVVDNAEEIQLDRADGETDAEGMVTFRNVVVMPESHLLAARHTLQLRLRAPGQLVDDPKLTLVLLPVRKVSLTAEISDSATFVIGAPMRWSVHVASTGENILPVEGVRVIVTLPDGLRSEKSSGPSGDAVFDSVVIHSPRLGLRKLLLQAPAFEHAPASLNVVLKNGVPDSMGFTSALPANYRVGQLLSFVVAVHDEFKNPSRTTVTIDAGGAGGSLRKSDTDTTKKVVSATDASGLAAFQDLRYIGPAGDVALVASAGTASATEVLHVHAGPPARIVIIDTPPTRIVADSALSGAPSVQVQDEFGNPVRDVPIRVTLCQNRLGTDCGIDKIVGAAACGKDAEYGARVDEANALRRSMWQTMGYVFTRIQTSEDVRRERLEGLIYECTRPLGFLKGRLVQSTDTTGTASFPDLVFVGPSGRYRLGFDFAKDTMKGSVKSPLMIYNGDQTYNRNFAIISAIKSVAGVSPANEFFDIRFRFRIRGSLSVMLNSDVALARQSFEDSTGVVGKQDRLIDAALAVNYERPKVDPQTSVPERAPFVGAHLRVFTTVPYIGVHAGSIELAHSKFQGSFLYVGYSRSLDRLPVNQDGVIIRPSKNNILIDAFVRSSDIDFFKFLNIRAGFMIPMLDRGRRPVSRLVVSVPIGGLISF
ncbi:MAG: hypothetical protein ABI877_14620 [Gemmatimonadaceae bacterium]